MPTITGTLSDIGLQALTPYRPRLEFAPSNPAVDGSGRVFATRPVEVAPDSEGRFQVELASTANLLPFGTYWRLSVKWLDQQGWDLVQLRLHVGDADASISDALASDPTVMSRLLHVGVTPPAIPVTGMLWIDTSGTVAVLRRWE